MYIGYIEMFINSLIGKFQFLETAYEIRCVIRRKQYIDYERSANQPLLF